MAEKQLTLYSTMSCPYCIKLKLQLKFARIGYQNVNVERDHDAAAFVMAANGGDRTVPTVLFADKSTLTNPSLRDVRAKLNTS